MAWLKQTEIENVIWELTMKLLGFDINDPKQQAKVRKSFQRESAPYQNIDEDICYFYISYLDNDINRKIESAFSEDDIPGIVRFTKGFTRVLNVQWIFYGPNSLDRASKLRFDLFSEFTKNYLVKYDIYLVMDVPEVYRTPESFRGRWWERVNLSVTFNNLVTIVEDIPEIERVNIQVDTDTGQQKLIKVNT